MENKTAVIGECMLELSQLDYNSDSVARPMQMSFGGDTLNTAIYLSRNDIFVTYVTGLGDDPNSDWLISEWQKEEIDCSLVERMKNDVPGMYMIDIDETGERSFYYWRKDSPASRLFDSEDKVASLFSKLADFQNIYLSGISLAILPANSLARLFKYLSIYRAQGGRIIFDGNYRPRLWQSVEIAQHAYQKMYQMTDIALPTLEDEELLFGYDSAELLVDVIRNHGVNEIVVKMGGEGCLAYCDQVTEYVAATPTKPVDTTAAGDSFNAGYLAQRLKGGDAVEACKSGHDLASKVIQHRGAIIPV
ncbi:MAG: sugar kinase [Acidiferrobacterales bacterium]|nr:sugar kinase [Acidiferrobacterales bacterium]